MKMPQENYGPISLMNLGTKILTELIGNQIQQDTKKIIYHEQLKFISEMQGWFNMLNHLK